MRLIIEKNYDLMSEWAANYVAKRINEFAPKESNPFVLGLPTGSSPVGMYRKLIELNKENIQRVTTRLCGTISSLTSTSAKRT